MGRNTLNRRKKAKVKKLLFVSSVAKAIRILVISSVLLVFLVIMAGLLYLNFQYKVGKSYIYALAFADGVSVVKHDMVDNEILMLNIDGEVGFQVSGGLGLYPLKSIYSLSQNEGTGTGLFKKTLMRNLHIPIHDVYDCRSTNKSDSLPISLVLKCGRGLGVKGVTFMLYGKWKAGKNLNINEIDDYNALVSDDTSERKVVSQNVFARLEFDFSSSMDIEEIENVKVVVPEGEYLPDFVSDVIKILGGRVVDTFSGDAGETGCLATGGGKIFQKQLKRIFDCKIQSDDGRDFQIKFSKEFLKSL